MVTIETATVDFLKTQIRHSIFDGHVFIAGGFVRDEVMGLNPKDIDLVVDLIDGGIRFANWITSNLELRKPVIFPRFGTAKFTLTGIEHMGVDLSSMEIEVVMARSEEYDGLTRKPKVKLGTLQEDVMRRDLTINSLIKNVVTGEILDLTGRGFDDIRSRIADTPIDPDKTFMDDPLRMLRVVRFSSKYNLDIPVPVWESIKVNKDQLNRISFERIREEFCSMLMTKHPSDAMQMLVDLGLMEFVVPELMDTIGVGQNEHHNEDVFNHTLTVLDGTEPILVNRLGALFHDIGKSRTKSVDDNGKVHFYKHELIGAYMTKRRMSMLKFDTETIEIVEMLVDGHMRIKSTGDELDMSDKAIRKFVRHFGDNLDNVLDLMHSDNVAHSIGSSMPNQIPNLLNRIDSIEDVKEPVKLPINGMDVMEALGLSNGGPEVGRALELVLDAFDENPKLTREEAFSIIM